MPRREDMIAGGFELAGWGLVALLIGIGFILASPFWVVGWGLYRLKVIRAATKERTL